MPEKTAGGGGLQIQALEAPREELSHSFNKGHCESSHTLRGKDRKSAVSQHPSL